MSIFHVTTAFALAMDLETLKVFCDVVETRSFSVAASQNFVTQSAVSQQIRTLEERYGRRLLERTRGNVQLTPAGEVLYQVSKEIVQRYQDMEARLQVIAQRVAGTVRVATVHSIGLYELSAQIKRYLKAYPQVHLHLEYSRSSKIYEDALRGQIDLGVVAYPSRRPQITVLPFREDRLVLACPPNHPLARHRQVSIRKLQGEQLVGYERDIPTRRETDRMLRRYGVEVRYVMELDNVETMKRVIEIGAGIAILPEPAVGPEVKAKSLAAVQLSDEHFLRPLGIIHRQGKHFSPATAKFIEFLRSECRRVGRPRSAWPFLRRSAVAARIRGGPPPAAPTCRRLARCVAACSARTSGPAPVRRAGASTASGSTGSRRARRWAA